MLRIGVTWLLEGIYMLRSGRFLKQVEGHTAFIPSNLPPDPPIRYDDEMHRILSDANQNLARLDGVASTLPNPDLFVAMYVRHEAVLSSQIEGTQSTLEDVLQFEIDPKGGAIPKDVHEVVNYIDAMKYGLDRLREGRPLCLKLIRQIHGRLMAGTRGGEKTPGEFRTSQNWIGSGGCTLRNATFVPPPVHAIQDCLTHLEQFMHETNLPILVRCALIHAQFETIHPFLDGNGRVGRLLITFLLCNGGVLHTPLLYLSHYLKLHRQEYYERLTAIRVKDDWEGWLKFFYCGIAVVSSEATESARRILKLRNDSVARILSDSRINSTNGIRLLDYLFERPLTTPKLVRENLGVAHVTANKLIRQFEEIGLLTEQTGFKRNQRFAYDPYLDVFAEGGTPVRDDSVPRQTTESKIDPDLKAEID